MKLPEPFPMRHRQLVVLRVVAAGHVVDLEEPIPLLHPQPRPLPHRPDLGEGPGSGPSGSWETRGTGREWDETGVSE